VRLKRLKSVRDQGFVSGHDFSRAVSTSTTEGFSPCDGRDFGQVFSFTLPEVGTRHNLPTRVSFVPVDTTREEIGLHQEDPRSQKRDLGHPSRYLRNLGRGLCTCCQYGLKKRRFGFFVHDRGVQVSEAGLAQKQFQFYLAEAEPDVGV
jgi:hypothetical protein